MRALLLAVTLTRTVVNTGFRMAYPFLPALARGLGVQPELVILAITLRSGLGLAGPLLGALGDTRGRRFAMAVGLAVFVVGLVPVAIWPSYATFLIAMLATGLSKTIFDPAQQAYFGDQIEFERRGTPLAIVESSWSGAYLIGIPAVGLLISGFGWQSPFPLLAALTLLGGIWLMRLLPGDSNPGVSRMSLRQGLAAILSRRSALAGLAVALLIAMGNEAVGIVYGVWMEGTFGLQVAALGAASAVIGIAELGGEGMVAGLSDRLGKRRSISVGLVFSALTLIALPLLAGGSANGQPSGNLSGALFGLFLMYLSFEFTIVGLLPLLTEQVPQARSTLMATAIGAFSIGRSLGALIGSPLYASGIQANTTVAAVLNLAALVVMLTLVDERGYA